MEWLQKKKIKVLEQSGQSSDLNPFKNLWNDMKWAGHRRSCHNLIELECFCKKDWHKIAEKIVFPQKSGYYKQKVQVDVHPYETRLLYLFPFFIKKTLFFT